ncbi:Hypothetical predicted protein [Pelobates cultripes]|uniref:Reverse transcriptase domain-containing protein n=1 Tax=Pelobates cultripes TaxID=61616 RepID=A0AAD1RI02_PELCU|nr:Hypothetical predicted protein [Pelobates cultripes]
MARTKGAPFLPSFFALSLEPLLQAIRLNHRIDGKRVRGTKYKVAAYANDILLTLTNLTTSVPQILTLIDEYANLSDYKSNQQINFSKSEYTSFLSPLTPILRNKLCPSGQTAQQFHNY